MYVTTTGITGHCVKRTIVNEDIEIGAGIELSSFWEIIIGNNSKLCGCCPQISINSSLLFWVPLPNPWLCSPIQQPAPTVHPQKIWGAAGAASPALAESWKSGNLETFTSRGSPGSDSPSSQPLFRSHGQDKSKGKVRAEYKLRGAKTLGIQNK